MGEMETTSRQRARRGEIQKTILRTVAAAGVLSVALLAPNALKMLKPFGANLIGRKKEIIIASRKRLVVQGLLEYAPNKLLKLTEQGKKRLRELELHDYSLKKPKRWDGKWRVLIFDIKEERRPLRNKIRRTLAVIGFIRLQDSVWVYPYDCEDLITLLKADFKVGKDLLYLIVDSIENDQWLKKHFGVGQSLH